MFTLPSNLSTGDYFVKTKVSYDENGFIREFSRVKRFKIDLPLLEREIFGIPVWYVFSLLALVGLMVGGVKTRTYFVNKSKRYHIPIELKQLPLVSSAERIFLGKLSEIDKNIYYDIDNLTTHTIVAGSTGGGKTVAAQDIVEEALNKKVGVVVFDPTAQWTGFFRKNSDKKMQSGYVRFGLKPKDARSYPGTILVVDDALQKIDLKRHLVPGEINVFSLHKLEPKEIDIFVASTVKQVFSMHMDESSSLKYLLVYDEVHRLLPKFGGSGAGFMQIERAAREFRKWGLGLILISQVLSDFIGEIKANINTEIQLRTKDDNDLERLKTKYGEEVLKSVVKAETGNGMLVNPSYNRGKPFMVNFRPLLHDPHRMSEADLEKYIKYSKIIDEISYNISLMKEKELDVFDLELELKLSKEKLAGGSFTMVEVYLEGLNTRLDETLASNGMKRKPVVIEKIDIDELKEEISRLKQSRNKITKSSFGNSQFGNSSAKPDSSEENKGYFDKFLNKLESKSNISEKPLKEDKKEDSSVNIKSNREKQKSFTPEVPAKENLNIKKSEEQSTKKSQELTGSDDLFSLIDKTKELKDKVDSAKRKGHHVGSLSILIKYIESDIDALKKHFVEDYFVRANGNLGKIQYELNMIDHINDVKSKIKDSLIKGISEKSLRDNLSNKGWPIETIDEIFESL